MIAYAAASGVVFFGLKAVGLSEKYSILGFGVIMAVLAGGSLGHPLHPIPLFSDNLRAGLALYGMIMFSFACFFSIPQAIEGLIWKPKLVPWSVLIGIGINLVCILAITLMALSLSKQVTPVAVIGWGKEVGGWVLILGSVFALLAMLTSYWAVSYALAVIIQQRLKWPYRLSWLSATLPSLIIALSGITGFLGFMRITGGAMAVMVAIMVIPALRKSRKLAPAGETAFSLGSWGGIFFQIIVILAYILMALGSVVSIKFKSSCLCL